MDRKSLEVKEKATKTGAKDTSLLRTAAVHCSRSNKSGTCAGTCEGDTTVTNPERSLSLTNSQNTHTPL